MRKYKKRYDKIQLSPTEDVVFVTPENTWIKVRTDNQRKYIQQIREKDLIVGIGPSGTGKSFLAVACALDALSNEKIDRIILTRPIVEAGENLGFLPGTLEEKINPYLRPLYDAFWFMLGQEKFNILYDEQRIEIAPLAYMRGRTLENAFIILDEAQNTTVEQMMMVLTRLGQNSKIIITGDVTQTDLPSSRASGLSKLYEIVGDHPKVAFQYFTEADVCRHPLVKDLVVAYEVWKQKNQK